MSDFTPHTPVQRISATEAVYRELMSMIHSDAVEVGQRLPGELALATQFGVSRSVVREALHALSTLGLTESRSGSGTYVIAKQRTQPLSFGGFSAHDLIEARQHIEIPTAGYAAARRTDEELAKLESILNQLDKAPDLRSWVRLDSKLHTMIATASHNPFFSTVVALTREALDPQSEFLNITQARQLASDKEHAEIVAAIASGSSAQAEQAMANHLSRVAEAVSRLES